MRPRVSVRLIRASAIASVICAAQAAHAQSSSPSPWYLQGSVGAFWRMDASRSTTIFNTLGTTGPGTDTNTYDPGPVVYLGIGYRLPHGFRIEGELGYSQFMDATASPLSTNGVFPRLNGSSLSLQSGGENKQYAAMVNAFYDLPISGRVVPYVGMGLGGVHSQVSTAHFTNANNPVFTQLGGNATNAAIMAEVGLTVTLDPKWALVPAYRFEHVFTNSGAFTYDANILKLGFRYSM
jgi:opacity protein-like surface antigen